MKKLTLIAPFLVVLVIILMACTVLGKGSECGLPNIDDAECTADIFIQEKTPSQIPETTPETTPEPHPFTDEEIVMLAKTMYGESQVCYWSGDQWGVSYIARQAAVGWVALNRYDDGGFGDTLAEILSRPHQFAYSPNTEITDHFLWLAEDVVNRWWAEKQGNSNAGRVIPPEYLFFHGDGRENYFRVEYENTGDYWNWSLPDPYEEVR